MAVAQDSLVATLRGPIPAWKLAARADPFHCFTWNGDQITVGTVRASLPFRAPTLRIAYAEGGAIRLTQDQRVVPREPDVSGAPTQAGDPTQVGLSMMPLYLGYTTHHYPTYKQMGDRRIRDELVLAPCDQRRVRLIARMVFEWKMGAPIPPNLIVRHIDGNIRNCEPANLRLEGKATVYRRHRLTRLKEAQDIRLPNNHRVAAVQEFGVEEVIDFESDDCDNLAIEGVFVKVKGR